jgi:hypothetical protein
VKHQQLKRPQENLVPNGGPNLNTCTQINWCEGMRWETRMNYIRGSQTFQLAYHLWFNTFNIRTTNNCFTYLSGKQLNYVFCVTTFIEGKTFLILWYILTMPVYQLTVADVPLAVQVSQFTKPCTTSLSSNARRTAAYD